MYYFFKYIRPLFLQVNLRQDISKWRTFFFFFIHNVVNVIPLKAKMLQVS